MDTFDHAFNFIEFWPSTVIDLIFQHLSAKEVINTTLVGRSWNDFISNHSLTCFKDIFVQPKVHEDLKYLVNSSRRYQHIKAVNISSIINELIEIINKPGRKWISIKLFRMQFTSKSQLEAILHASFKTIKLLEFHSLSCGSMTEGDSYRKFTYPRLVNLSISYHLLDEGERWLNSFFAEAPQLKFIHLANACDEQIRNMIIPCKVLKSLSITGRFQDLSFFKKLSDELSSQLEEFYFNDIESNSGDDINLAYFDVFFKSQSRTLKRFETNAIFDEFETAFKMPKLDTLSIKSFQYNQVLIEEMLESARISSPIEAHLKVLDVRVMDQNLLELMANYARGLKVLRVNKLEANDISNPSWFPSLQIVKIVSLRQSLEQQIREKSEDDRSKLETLILKELDVISNSPK